MLLKGQKTLVQIVIDQLWSFIIYVHHFPQDKMLRPKAAIRLWDSKSDGSNTIYKGSPISELILEALKPDVSVGIRSFKTCPFIHTAAAPETPVKSAGTEWWRRFWEHYDACMCLTGRGGMVLQDSSPFSQLVCNMLATTETLQIEQRQARHLCCHVNPTSESHQVNQEEVGDGRRAWTVKRCPVKKKKKKKGQADL